MARISDIFKLNKSQHELDFVNINPNRDFPVYLNPFVFSSRSDPFSIQASRTITSFFQHNLTLINQGMIDDARANFQHLHEPNETCLGQSRQRPRGRGVGEDNANDLFNSILNSEAMIIPLTDADIVEILERKKLETTHYEDEILSARARRVMNI